MKVKFMFMIFILLSVNIVFADNGIWHFAEDIRPGIFGSDEGNNSNYIFNNSVEMRKNLYVNNVFDSDVGTIRDDNGGWIRTYGETGWYSQTYGGGWYMLDPVWIRAVNNKNIYTGGIIRSDSSLRSPIFYDQDNTGYYVNPASTSNLNRVLVNRYPPTDSRDVATKRYVDSKVSSSGWPAGSYCIWKNGACPSGFSHRSMTLDVGTHSHDMSPNEGPIGSSYATGSTRSWFYFHACCK